MYETAYKVELIPRAKKDLDRLDKKIFAQIKDRILTLASNPRPNNCIKLTTNEGYRVRSGVYRILYRIDDKKKIVYIYRIKHRKDVYR